MNPRVSRPGWMSRRWNTWRSCQYRRKAEDGKRDGQEEHRPPAHDQRIAEDEEDHSRHPEEDEAEVEEGHEVVDAGDVLRENAGLLAWRVRPQHLEHAACPARSLAHEAT